MATLPALPCPRCAGASEYQTTIEVLDPPLGKIDVAFCADCCCLFEWLRESGTAYESTAWPPVCRICRQAVSVVGAVNTGDDLVVDYQCRDHGQEAWQSSRRGERWIRRSGAAG